MDILTEEEQEKVMYAISLAESRTSGEIRIVIERRCKDDPLDRAAQYFHHLGMDKHSLHHGVLIYVAVDDHRFAILGDSGINAKVGTDFWEETKQLMLDYFRKDDLVNGLVAGITHAGDQLRRYFPRLEGDVNELPDDIIFGDGNEL